MHRAKHACIALPKQDDLLNAHHTVEETLVFSAKVGMHCFAKVVALLLCMGAQLASLPQPSRSYHSASHPAIPAPPVTCPQLRLPPDTTPEELDARVEEAIDACKLHSCRWVELDSCAWVRYCC